MPESSGLISVALPGPWWTELTYSARRAYADGHAPEPGARVRVPVGRGSRVALVLGKPGGGYDGEIREIISAIDERALLPPFLMKLIRWFGDTYLCGAGSSAKVLLPTAFMGGQELDLGADPPCTLPPPPEHTGDAGPGVSFVYDPADSVRFSRYLDMLSDRKPTLISFPLYPAAKKFHEALLLSDAIPDDLKRRTMLFPRSGAKAEWRAWSRLAATEEISIVIGGQSSATAPLRGIRRIIVEDESNNIWRTVRPPVHNVRSLMAKRARLEGAELVLGGRMPSSRAFAHSEKGGLAQYRDGMGCEKPSGRTYFVDIKLAYSPSVKGICDTLAVSEALVRETETVVSAGNWAVWLLDRKGYAGEVLCEECGMPASCSKCGGAMRWEASKERLRCVVCSASEAVPEICGACGGRLLTAKRPGLEALLPLARAAINADVPILLLGDDDMKDSFLQALGAGPSGLLLGTRAVLSMCDSLRVGLVGWIDADGEARSRDYDARSRAFGLMWESRWRGLDPGGRTLVLQSRRPGKEWQKGLEDARFGWRIFWKKELAERSEFGMPPYSSLIRIDSTKADTERIAASLEQSDDFEYWISEADTEEPPGRAKTAASSIWIRTLRLRELRRTLTPFFHIKRAGRGYPRITVWHE